MCSWCEDYGPNIKDIRRGGVEVDDFDKEVNYAPKSKKSKTKKEKTRPGCPGNEYKEHVYVWTTETEYRDFFYDYWGFPKKQSRVCVGCGKRSGSKPSDEYMKRKEREWAKLATPEKGVPISSWRSRNGYLSFKWWSWEYRDEDYRKARKEYVDRHGWPKYMYGF